VPADRVAERTVNLSVKVARAKAKTWPWAGSVLAACTEAKVPSVPGEAVALATER
jgi:hypothetical protein